MSEFDLINQYFKSASRKRDDVVLGIGDDCALLSPPTGKQLAVTTDTLINGVHFPPSTSAEDIGYKSLAVNLSDLAAMGAEPAWASLAISLPEPDEHWLAAFMQGFSELAQQYNVALIGGDTTRGPLSITITVTGFVSPGAALKRSTAKAGDSIFVTGSLGDAKIALDNILNNKTCDQNLEACFQRLNRPQPRVKAGLLLSDFAVAAIDLSDGLFADLTHICEASNVGAMIFLEQIPLSVELKKHYQQQPVWQNIIGAGDDYELCFCCEKNKVDKMLSVMNDHQIAVSCIGEITESKEIQCLLADGSQLILEHKGYNHFG